MENRLKKIFNGKDHKKIMLVGLYLSSIVIFIILAIVSAFMGYDIIVWTKLLIVVLDVILYYSCLRSDKIQHYAVYLILIVEFDSAFVMLNQQLNHFVTIYPFFIIFGFFFFFRLSTAIWMTIIHLLYWLSISAYGHIIFPEDPTFQVISLANIIVSSFIATVFAFFYHISTELTYEKLEHANRQKSILLKEIHHRIKNSLNKISSMIGLQILSIKNGNIEDTEEVLRKSKLRIEAMAMVHDALYKTRDIGKIEFDDYIKNLTSLIKHTYDRSLSVEVCNNHKYLPIDTVMKIGLIINELMTNTIKHAVVLNEEEIKILISLSEKKDNCLLEYHQTNTDKVDETLLQKNDTLGMRLIRLTVKEMGGDMKISNSDGLKFLFRFSC